MKQGNKKILHLFLIPGIGPVTINKIIKSPVSLDQLYHLGQKDFVQLCSLSLEQAKKIVLGLNDLVLLEKELDRINVHQINWTTILDDGYPDSLKQIYCPPPVVYWKGSLVVPDQKQIAFVGARRAKSYARRSLEQLIPELVKYGWTIVSGGALGADTMAHQIALQSGGKTVAVLGSGLLRPYPPSNNGLFKKLIAAGGSVVSPFSLLTEPLAGNFPARNRIIAGLSSGCVVVQAAEKSGALITAYHALEQGKEVFAIPGSIDDELSGGCHALIRQGAHLVTSVQDIFDVYDMGFVAPRVTLPKVPDLPLEAQKIVDCCSGPMSLDELLEKTALPVDTVRTHIFELQLKGILKQTISGLWELA